MRQPELGKKISELRKAKGLTQEELVEKCNISVRTIQRIETSDVTPRMYTIKTILAALDQDLEAVEGPVFGRRRGFDRCLVRRRTHVHQPQAALRSRLLRSSRQLAQ